MNKENITITKFGVTRSKCSKCNSPACSICKTCGMMCNNHGAIHRHETGHLIDLLDWKQNLEMYN